MGKLIDLRLNQNDTIEKITDVYMETAIRVNEMLQNIYGDEKIVFPVDLNKIAMTMEIDLKPESMNSEDVNRFSKILGKLITTDKELKIEYDKKVGFKTQRYAIAHAIARYLIKDNQNISEISYAIPLIPTSLDEIRADMIALFMLLPMETFKEEFSNYLENCTKHPIDVDNWLFHLSDVSQVSFFNLSIGYQQLKQVLCYQRQQKFLKNMDFEEMKKDNYKNIYA